MIKTAKPKQIMLLCSLLLTAVVAALYSQFLSNPIVFDDLASFMLDAEGRSNVFKYADMLSPLGVRSLPYATLAWTAQLFGFSLTGFHMGNLLLHLATVLALFLFLVQLFDAVLPEYALRNGLGPIWTAFFAALLFGLHPIAVYAVGYLIQRTILMATLFSLLAMYAYMRGCVKPRQLWLWGSVFFFYLAVYSKEHVIVLPAVMLALTVLLHKDWPIQIKRRLHIFAAYAAIAIHVMLAKKGVLAGVYEINAPEMLKDISPANAYPFSVLTQSWLFFKYGLLWLFPNPDWMSVDIRVPFAQSYFSFYLFAFVAYLGYGLVALRLLFKRGRVGLLGFALIFPWLMFMTEFSTVRIQEPFVLYRSYLWATGACALLPFILWNVTKRGAVLVLPAIATFMFIVAMERLSTFSHPVLLWEDAEKLVHGRSDLPGAYRIYYNLGTEYIKIDQPDKAIRNLKRAIELYADQPSAYGNLGAAYTKKGEMEQALAAFGTAIQVNENDKGPPEPRHYFGRGMAYEAQKNWIAASEDYKVSCKLAGRGCDKTNLPQVSTPTSTSSAARK